MRDSLVAHDASLAHPFQLPHGDFTPWVVSPLDVAIKARHLAVVERLQGLVDHPVALHLRHSALQFLLHGSKALGDYRFQIFE